MPIIYRSHGALDHFPALALSALRLGGMSGYFHSPAHPRTQAHACWDLGWWGWMRKSFT